MSIEERARDLGKLVGQTDEYQAWKRSNDRLMQETELRSNLERLRALQIAVGEQLERGVEPTAEQQGEIEKLVGAVQSHAVYQAAVAAQTNLDKLMNKMNRWIAEGMEKGAESRIITLG